MNPSILQTPIDYLKGVGPNRADLLRTELGVQTYQDLINLFPNRYIDKTRYYKINELQRGNGLSKVVIILPATAAVLKMDAWSLKITGAS